MGRSKKDILGTEVMLTRLSALLYGNPAKAPLSIGDARKDAEALRRISMALHRWHEMECNEDVRRGHLTREWDGAASKFVSKFTDDENGKTYICSHGQIGGNRFYSIPDREKGALKRLAAIMARYPKLQAYVQTDPRGCALYILAPGDVPEGERAESYYSRGLAVHQ